MTTELLGSIEDLTVTFARRPRWGDLRPKPFTAVDHATLDLRAGEITGLVGESGSGKSTVARALLKLTPFTGDATICGFDLSTLPAPPPLAYRRTVQAVFQDPLQALNPRHSVADIVAEPLVLHTDLGSRERRDRVIATLESVGLDSGFLPRTTRELSGGQRQRVAIARAIIVDPSLLILDEALSALDVTTAASVARLLHGLLRPDSAMLFIGHDLAMIRQLCDRVHVMREGRIVESGTADEVCGSPQHEYTRLLVDSIPQLLRADT
ncbi:ABC transporter ATP-binding protein [Aeromicrobium sp. YIM 150415]|uniref:ATP-binding cassette domain-containing protein n=1 Tax=Aeromicrobium sp. YIM 150415 TaxID=2803912 RepID=UPI0019641A4E|nr:ATP-binding cassette domain-containing protein [Aeromicrobium sp. YIM 150415]MBM9463349.1 ABC transporter ATP-binding protein [Aeromicrobium sp. YIM 150415]